MFACFGIVLLCLLFIFLLPAFAIAFVACMIGIVLKMLFAILGFGLKITFSSVFLVALVVAFFVWIL